MNVHSALRTGWMLVAAGLIAGCAVVSHLSTDGVPDGSRPGEPPRVAAPAPPRREPVAVRPRVDIASWYGEWHQGRLTASGQPYDLTALTAAHRSLPIGACVEVTHLGNGRHVFVRVNDRGPYLPGRTIDLSQRAAEELGMVDEGLARVKIRGAPAEVCEG